MVIGGLQKLTLLDFPGRVACTVFLSGCNFRCPFCHNTPLVLGQVRMDEGEVFNFLEKRRGLLEGVTVTGGEPLCSPDTVDFLRRIKDLGYLVKLDTNGAFPERLRKILEAGLADCVAMDIKNSREKYEMTCGVSGWLPKVEQSVQMLLAGKIACEFRTTVVDELHEPEDFAAIGRWLTGAKQYFLQGYVDSGDILMPGLHAADREKMEACLKTVQKFIPAAALRGV